MTAFACVACLVVLQCFVILPAITEQAHAAGDLVIGAEYQDDYSTYANRTISGSFLDGVSDRTEVVIGGEEGEDGEDGEGGEEIVLEGPKLKAILSEAGLSKIDRVEVGGEEVKWSDSSYFVVTNGDNYQLYKKNGDGAELVIDGFSDIYVKRDSSVRPISWSQRPASDKISPTVGDTIKVKYKLSVDKFYKKSDDYDKGTATKLTWSANSKVKLQNKTTTGTSGTVKAKVTKAGSITITPESEAFPDLTEGVKVSFTGQQTTTTTRATTRSSGGGYTPYRPTARTGAATAGTTTGTTGAPTTATRPEETTTTEAPTFQTITVKEVYLNPVTEGSGDGGDMVYYDENGNPIEDDSLDDPEGDDAEDDYDRDGVSFPAAAGSAAVAAAACGAGAVGRIRRFRFDMGDAAASAVTSAGAADGKRSFRRGSKAAKTEVQGRSVQSGAEAQEKPGEKPAEKKSRNPLGKLRKKS